MRGNRGRRGNATMNMGVFLVAFGACALVVDLGWGWVQRSQLQSIGDAASTAAASHLDGTYEGVIAARAAASSVLEGNLYYGKLIDVKVTDGNATGLQQITFGHWNERAQTFTLDDDVEDINAVHVQLQNTNSEAWFAPVLWEDTQGMETQVASVAMRIPTGASEVECYLPIALPDCYFYELEGMDPGDCVREDDADHASADGGHGKSNGQSDDDECGDDVAGDDFCTGDDHAADDDVWADDSACFDDELRLSPAGDDNMGWARVGSRPNANWLRSQIADPCQGDKVGIGDQVYLQNGVVVPAMEEVEEQIEQNGSRWSDQMGGLPQQSAGSTNDTYGNTWEGPILIFDGGPAYCSGGGGKWNGSEEVVGIAWGVLYDVDTEGGAASKNMHMRVDFDRLWEEGTAGDGPNYGVIHRGVTKLVR